MSNAREVRLVLGFSPGSLSDHVARIVCDVLASELGAPVNVALKPGASGTTAAAEVAAAPPDGSVLFMATVGTHALAPLVGTARYDALRDFTCLSVLTRSPLLLGCHPSVAATNVSEFVARARERELTYGTSAIGGAPHLAAALFEQRAGVKMRHVRYDETERLYRDLAAGAIDLSFNNIISMLPRCRTGKLRALGVTSRERASAAPDIPTIAESGVTGYDMTNWTGIVGPAGMAEPLVRRLSAAVTVAVQSASVSSALTAQGIIPCGGTPQAFADFIRSESEKWRPVVTRLRGDVGAGFSSLALRERARG